MDVEGSLKSKDVSKTWHFGWQKRKSKSHREIQCAKKLNVWRREAALRILVPLLARIVALGEDIKSSELCFAYLCNF